MTEQAEQSAATILIAATGATSELARKLASDLRHDGLAISRAPGEDPEIAASLREAQSLVRDADAILLVLPPRWLRDRRSVMGTPAAVLEAMGGSIDEVPPGVVITILGSKEYRIDPQGFRAIPMGPSEYVHGYPLVIQELRTIAQLSDFFGELMRLPAGVQTLGAVRRVLDALTYREREIVKLLAGMGDGYTYTREEVGRIFNLNSDRVLELEQRALEKLADPLVAKRAKEYLATLGQGDHRSRLEHIVAEVKELSPELMAHLKSHTDDLERVEPEVFQDVVAELLARSGFEEVAVVGRCASTSADILAVSRHESTGARFRWFVEVKCWKDRVGVGVIDRVHGAVVSEKPRFGWHLGMIVSTAGFCDFQKYTRRELDLRGILLRDKDDVISWLRDYRPSDKGLWLPKGFRVTEIPTQQEDTG